MWMMLSAESMKVVLIGGDNEEELREEVLEDGATVVATTEKRQATRRLPMTLPGKCWITPGMMMSGPEHRKVQSGRLKACNAQRWSASVSTYMLYICMCVCSVHTYMLMCMLHLYAFICTQISHLWLFHINNYYNYFELLILISKYALFTKQKQSIHGASIDLLL